MSLGAGLFYYIVHILVCILLSRKTMEYMPRIRLWLSCSTCCDCTAQSWSDKLCCSYYRCSLCLAPWLLMLPSAVYTLSSLSTDRLSSACLSECLPWWLASNCCGLQLQLPSLLDWNCLPSDLIYSCLWSEGQAFPRSGASDKLAIQHILGDSAILHRVHASLP